ncbi:MAG: OmpA family protein [Rhodobacteraceae bacterium]|nr:OmpA family protein [Paracoccaceae bacterium]
MNVERRYTTRHKARRGANLLTRAATVAATAALLAACADHADVDAVRALPNGGSAFHKALQNDYADLAGGERAEADWKDAVFFTGRAERAANGETFPPQGVSERQIPDHAVGDMTQARTRLMAVLNDDNRRALPAQASLAQTGFDCWLQEQEEDIQPEDIAACKRTFDQALSALENAVVERPSVPAPAAAPLPKQFEVLFDFNSANLNATARATVSEIGAAYKAYNPATVLVVGHTDTAGASDYNIGLSQRRAETVANALAAEGIDQNRMRIEAYGEVRPATSTGDGVKEQANRRVDVVFDKQNGQ